MTTKGKPASNDAHITSGQNDSMAQIRELLFGDQQRSTDAQLLSTNERIEQLRQHTLGRLAETEEQLNKRLEQLGNSSTENYQDLQAELREGLYSLQQQLERRIDDVETLLQSQQAELARQMGAEQDRLQNDKINRSQLARLLNQLAAQIESND